MKKKEINYAHSVIFKEINNLRCKDLHHKKKHQHKEDVVCPVEYHLHRQMYIITEAMREAGLIK